MAASCCEEGKPWQNDPPPPPTPLPGILVVAGQVCARSLRKAPFTKYSCSCILTVHSGLEFDATWLKSDVSSVPSFCAHGLAVTWQNLRECQTLPIVTALEKIGSGQLACLFGKRTLKDLHEQHESVPHSI